MEDWEICFEFEKLQKWKDTSDELRLSTLIHYMQEYNVDESYDHYVLLTLAANGFLKIEYDRQVVDDSVLRYMDNEALSSLWDDIYICNDKNYSISIIHTVPDNHPLHPFVEYIQSHYANNYTHSHDFYASKFEADFELSYLMLLIGEEKLRENYRKIILDTYQPKSDGALWEVPNENIIDLDESYLSHLHDGVFPEPTTIQRWYGEWESFVVNFLDIKQGCVYDLHAGVGTLAMHLNLDNVVYRANTQHSKERNLMSMLFYTDVVFEDYYARNQIQLNKDLISSWEEGKLADYVIANLCNIRTEDANDYRKRLYVFGDIIDQMSSEGKALVACNNQQLKDASSCISLVDSIILLKHGRSIVLLNKNKENTKVIKVYDRTDWEDFTAEQLLQSIREQENLQTLTPEDINDMGGYFDINVFKRNQYKIDVPAGDKLIKLSEVLTLQNGYRLRGSMKDVRFLRSDIKDYTPLSPYVTAENGEYISESDVKERWYRLVDQKRLVVLALENHFRTFIFDPRDGEAGFPDFSSSFIVDEGKVNIDYLVYQMNEDYFLKQLFPSGGFSNYIHPKAKDILSCRILVPDVESSVERQKQEIEDLRQKEIAKIARRYGFDLGKFVQYKASDLLKGTTLNKGKYTVVGVIGHGGFGKVYKARNEETGEIVAIKEFFYHSRQVRDPETNNVRTNFADIGYVDDAKDKFRRERDKIKECAHGNIVKVYEEFEENNTCYYSMEYIDGENLVNKKGIGELESLAIIRQVAEALKAMHEKRYNHSDVKPQNILLDSNGVATLIDFSGAHYYGDEEEGLSKTGNSIPMEIMTPGYTPNCAYKAKGFHAGRDIYSLGATLYYMLTGNEPATIDNKAKPAKMSSKSWRAICSAVEEDPRKWLRSMDEFLALLPGDEEIGDMDVPEPTNNLRITPRPVMDLQDDEVFVFGSNLAGHHSGGAAKQALKWGAKWYVASGPMGQTYGIPTVGVHGLDAVERYVSQFIKYVKENDHITFYVTAIGCGSAGFSPEQIAPLFRDCIDLSNVYLPESFWKVLMNKGFIKAEGYKVVHKDNHAKDRGEKKHDEATKKEQEHKEIRERPFRDFVKAFKNRK